jgi:hypothetical protein
MTATCAAPEDLLPSRKAVLLGRAAGSAAAAAIQSSRGGSAGSFVRRCSIATPSPT